MSVPIWFLVRGGCTQPVQMWVLKFSRIWLDNFPSEASEITDLPIIIFSFVFFAFDSGLWWLP
ncbi:hypothetical protein N665_1435s0001 [Sinapis alba]|nr:hypothetical protein N665_1435s0001 [Sinapis alba]